MLCGSCCGGHLGLDSTTPGTMTPEADPLNLLPNPTSLNHFETFIRCSRHTSSIHNIYIHTFSYFYLFGLYFRVKSGTFSLTCLIADGSRRSACRSVAWAPFLKSADGFTPPFSSSLNKSFLLLAQGKADTRRDTAHQSASCDSRRSLLLVFHFNNWTLSTFHFQVGFPGRLFPSCDQIHFVWV